MQQFSDIVKLVRTESGLSQNQLAKELGVSAIYISKIETGQKKASKQFLSRLAKYLDVHPAALAPFLFLNNDVLPSRLGPVEKILLNLGDELQKQLINKRIRHGDN